MIKNRAELPKLFRKIPVKTGAELGVAAGNYSSVLISSHKFDKFFCIDKWNDHHNENERLKVKRKFANNNNVEILHTVFSKAVLLFEDNFFDFIYIDGYAHTGQNNGETLRQWFPKLKKGGIFAGHDYCQKRWPKTYQNVNKFLKEELKYKIHTTKEPVDPSWYILK
jgi:hypothetical protein